MKKYILVYSIDDETKVERFNSDAGIESTYNCLKSTFGNRFKLEFVASIRNELSFKKVKGPWYELEI